MARLFKQNKMKKTYKFKLYRTKRLKHLHQIINISGIIYNHCIALHKRYYKLYGKHLNKYQLQKHLTKLKKLDKYSFWKLVPSQAIQDITDRIDRAYKLFFNSLKQGIKSSPPSFKRVKKYKSFTLKQSNYRIENNIIYINKYKFKFWLSRDIIGNIKTITVKRDKLGNFFIFVTVETKYENKPNNTATGKIVGIDFGLKTFLTLSDNTKIQSPEYFLKKLNQTRKLNRALSKKQKGSKKHRQARIKLSKHHRKIADTRRDFFFKLANEISKNYEYVVIEDLNIKAMQRIWGRKVSDIAYSEFIRILETKVKVIKIDRFYPSSKTCSVCGYKLEELDLKTRNWICPNCKTNHDRDLNAATNICRVGASTLGTEVVRLALASWPCFKARIPRL